MQFFFKVTVPHLSEVDFSMKDHLTSLFIQENSEAQPDEDGIKPLPWRSAKFVFDMMRPIFDSEVYSLAILKGLITSSGGLTESTLKASQNSLFEYLSSMSKGDAADGITQKKKFIKKLMVLYESN